MVTYVLLSIISLPPCQVLYVSTGVIEAENVEKIGEWESDAPFTGYEYEWLR